MEKDLKDLLLKELCARIPYRVKVRIDVSHDCFLIENITTLFWDPDDEYACINGYKIDSVKPYLFPLSSMTEEQFNELKSYVNLKWEHNTLELVEWDINYKTLEFWLEEIPSYHVIKVFDWLNKNHFDYRGLIEKSLAIDATNKNIYNYGKLKSRRFG